ncbi:MAG: HAD hydrolase-like protein [Cellulosilyticaceae bacterium]
MNNIFENYRKIKEFLVCVDSDGCAMDTMDIKHHKCFGPEMIRVWQLFEKEESIIKLWNHINLYSRTRGINRFKGLAKTFQELSKDGIIIPDLESLLNWVEEATELSNPSLEREIEKTNSSCLKQTLEWSLAVNESIKNLPTDDEPFPNVKKGLAYLATVADVSVVSSANGGALDAEWNRHELTQYIQLLLGQEAGTKSICISHLKDKGYKPENVLMVGDAPGDLEAARANGVKFYPILVGKESFSWERLHLEAMSKLMEGTFDEAYQEQLIQEFEAILK